MDFFPYEWLCSLDKALQIEYLLLGLLAKNKLKQSLIINSLSLTILKTLKKYIYVAIPNKYSFHRTLKKNHEISIFDKGKFIKIKSLDINKDKRKEILYLFYSNKMEKKWFKSKLGGMKIQKHITAKINAMRTSFFVTTHHYFKPSNLEIPDMMNKIEEEQTYTKKRLFAQCKNGNKIAIEKGYLGGSNTETKTEKTIIQENMEKTNSLTNKKKINNKTKANKNSTQNNIIKSESSVEKLNVQLHKLFCKLEEGLVSENHWYLTGEVTSDRRPINSAIEIDMDFKRANKFTPQTNKNIQMTIEDIIQKRICDGRFDDPSTKLPKKPIECRIEPYEKEIEKRRVEIHEEVYIQQIFLSYTQISNIKS
jgi:hypothetical protein